MPHRRILAALIAVTFTDSLADEFLHPLLVVLLENQGTSAALIGLATSVGDLGILLTAPFVPWLVRVVRPVSYVRGSLLLLAVAVFLFPLFANVYAWIALEFAFGVVTCGFLVLSDALVNAASGESQRGRLLAVYMLSESCGAILGPLLLSGVGFEGLLPFCVASAIMLAGIAPWFVVDALQVPTLAGEDAAPFRAAARSAPLLLLVAAAGAFFQDVPAGLLPVFALERGLGEATAVLMLSALALGSAIFQLPAGWGADRMARRTFLALLSTAAIPLSLALSFAAGSWAMWPLLLLLGGVFQAIELIGLVLLGQRASPSRLAGLTAAATMSGSTSSFVGPPVVGWLMDAAGPDALFVAIGCVAALVLAACALDRARRGTGADRAAHPPGRGDRLDQNA